jgi:acetoin utilization deacetylase AcuC-like enzyme
MKPARMVKKCHYLRMKCSYHPDYQTPLPPGHPFPMSKYPLLKEQLLHEGVLQPGDLLEPEPLDLESMALVHTPAYLEKLQSSALSTAEQRRLGLPWSQALWRRSRLACGGTLLAARHALEQGIAGNLAGGTHHAFADHGEGFCVLNDVAIAILELRAQGAIRRAIIIDLDVHQGNGSAAIFEFVDEVFTFSMHGERNYPLAKMRSSLDVALEDGGDVAAGDRYGKLALTEQGIRLRERLVIDTVRSRGVPLTIVLAGGYAVSRARTAELHAHVFREAVAYDRP